MNSYMNKFIPFFRLFLKEKRPLRYPNFFEYYLLVETLHNFYNINVIQFLQPAQDIMISFCPK